LITTEHRHENTAQVDAMLRGADGLGEGPQPFAGTCRRTTMVGEPSFIPADRQTTL
jgi:hypothetical protein